MDGKTMRGTIPAGQSRGLHLLGIFLPAEGWMIVQVEVDGKENEITAAPRVLSTLDLRGKIVIEYYSEDDLNRILELMHGVE